MLVDGKSAEPADLSIVAQSSYLISVSVRMPKFGSESKDAFKKAGLEPDEAFASDGRLFACPP